jgi:hypothetical protein
MKTAHIQGYSPYSGSIGTLLANMNIQNPYTKKPYSEALLMGVSGGPVFGNFFFHYEGFAPQVNILTRNSFQNYGWDAITERLGIAQDVIHSTNSTKADEKLKEAMEEGQPAIVWADVFTLGYEYSEMGKGMWAVFPVTVFDVTDSAVFFADRSRVPLSVEKEIFLNARGKIKKDKFRITLLEAPDESKIPSAMIAGIKDCISLFKEKPPKGSVNNFGFKGYEKFISDIALDKGKSSWSKTLKTPQSLFAGLTTAYKYSQLYWKDESRTADRQLYADFLFEAAAVLEKPALKDAAGLFSQAGELWKDVGDLLLPKSVPLLDKARNLLDSRHSLFLNKGNSEEVKALDTQLAGLSIESFDFDRASLADGFRAVSEKEFEAIQALEEAVS